MLKKNLAPSELKLCLKGTKVSFRSRKRIVFQLLEIVWYLGSKLSKTVDGVPLGLWNILWVGRVNTAMRVNSDPLLWAVKEKNWWLWKFCLVHTQMPNTLFLYLCICESREPIKPRKKSRQEKNKIFIGKCLEKIKFPILWTNANIIIYHCLSFQTTVGCFVEAASSRSFSSAKKRSSLSNISYPQFWTKGRFSKKH